ncbi:hypothetical protein HA050_13905 [Iodobacter sp. HSC-16F04]|uniref:Uncharacterized protein n=1 Tax=Iodobacter violaceini TaxID=3044271 RepID=A0ABX0KRG0_9NEIS|nr:hypothetical protein [Iodobacter violacea]NHQ87206.1 hypothetical protein [Iodobacter violacea]
MNNALSAQPECGLSEIPPAGAAALAAFLSAPPSGPATCSIKTSFLTSRVADVAASAEQRSGLFSVFT